MRSPDRERKKCPGHLPPGGTGVPCPRRMGEGGRRPGEGFIFVIFAAMFITLGWIMAALLLTTGRFLARRKHHQFCLVMAGIECLFMPFGTFLGVFTILVLVRESVKPLFGVNPPNSAAKGLH